MILGIECTAHTFGIALVNKGKIISNLRDMYLPEKGGIIPTESANHHKKVAEDLYQRALQESNTHEKQITAIALSNAPGLSPCLRIGLDLAQQKAVKLSLPIIPVNHCVAHLEISRSVGAHDPVLLYASGANTQIIAYAAGKYRVFGETLDIGIGNFIDKFARYVGLAFPGGPKIEEAAKIGRYHEFPYSIKGMDVSFSGLQTKLQQLYDRGVPLKDLAFSLQETAFAMLVEAAERAMAHTSKDELALGGGVGCNARLQEMCQIMCKERGARFFCPEKSLLVDNAAMIAFTGEIMFNVGIKYNPSEVDIKPRERTDDVPVTWR